MNKILKIENLTHIFDSNSAGIFDISMTLLEDDFIIIAGKNGCGKTTLLRHFNGLLKPDSGRVLLNDQDIQKNLVLARRKIGMVFQDPDTQIIGDTVFDEVAFGPENLGINSNEISKKVNQTLEQLNLSNLKDRNPTTLSGGEKRRLAVAGILVMEPKLIIFDEPFANLDYPSILSLVKLLKDLHKLGHAIIVTTHDIAPLINIATKMVIMDKGKIVEKGDPEKLCQHLESHGVRNPFTPTAQAWQL